MNILIFIILLITSCYTISLPIYGNFCGRDFNIDDNHIEYPIDEIDRMCQIYYICIEAYFYAEKCFCNQQALNNLVNIKKESDTRTLYYKIFAKEINIENCSRIYIKDELQNSYGISNTIKFNYLTFYPPYYGTVLRVPLCQDFLYDNVDNVIISYSFLNQQEYADFLIRHNNEPCAYVNSRRYIVTDRRLCALSAFSYIPKIHIQQNKILVIIAGDSFCIPNNKIKLSFTFENNINPIVVAWSLFSVVLLLLIVSIIIVIKLCRRKEHI